MERIKPVEAVAILKEHGMEVNIDEAELILEFVYAMAGIAVAQCLREEEDELSQTE